jgi:hypothetical protein
MTKVEKLNPRIIIYSWLAIGTHHTNLVIWKKNIFEIWQILAICFMDYVNKMIKTS